MPLVTSRDMLLKARQEGYAVGAFNCENAEMMQAILLAAQEMRAPVILQTTPSTIRYAPLRFFVSNMRLLAEQATIPVALHLDHGDGLPLAIQAIQAGYTSIMYDGSRKPFEENVHFTGQIAQLCAAASLPLEGELGSVGGKEDDTSGETVYTDPEQAEEFVERTGVSSLAIGVGTAHGIYRQQPVLRVDLIGTLRSRLNVPLVLHGASGLAEDALQACVKQGISKINFATDLRCCYTKAVRDYLEVHSECIDPKQYLAQARQAVKERVKELLSLCGCVGKA